MTGLCWVLVATSARGWRFLGWGYLTLLTLLIATGGKDYYLAPYYPMLFAAGGVAIERWTAAGQLAHRARRVARIDAARRGARGSPGCACPSR